MRDGGDNPLSIIVNLKRSQVRHTFLPKQLHTIRLYGILYIQRGGYRELSDLKSQEVEIKMQQQFTNQQDNVTWVFLEDELKSIISYINKFGEPKTEVKKYKNEEDFKSQLNTIKEGKDFIEMKF